jgi:hypothetical protein
VFIFWVGGYAKQAWERVEAGPRVALTAGFNGDIPGFKAEFYGDGASAPDDQVQAFINELRQRYGAFVSSQFNEASGQSTQPQPGNPVVPFPYVLTFDQGKVDATATIIFADQQKGTFINRLQSIVIHDPQRGDVEFPPPAAPPATPAGSAKP